jgi:hypothetical protein
MINMKAMNYCKPRFTVRLRSIESETKEVYMKKFFVGILSVYLSLAGSLALADGQGEYPWCHVPLQSTDGTKIEFDYSAFLSSGRFGSYFSAQPWVQVSNDQLNGSEHVRVVLTPHNSPWIESSTIDLNYDQAQHRFTGEAPQAITIEADLNAQQVTDFEKIQPVTVSLSVVIDGDWKTDPVSGSNNFELNLSQNPGACDN